MDEIWSDFVNPTSSSHQLIGLVNQNGTITLIGTGKEEGEVELLVGWLVGEGAWEILNGRKQLNQQNQKSLESNQFVVTAVGISESGEIKPTQLQR
jgi:aspartate/methionine/tyrosine aminotransferase